MGLSSSTLIPASSSAPALRIMPSYGPDTQLFGSHGMLIMSLGCRPPTEHAMKRLTLTVLLALSLFFSAFVSFLWVRGQFARDGLWYTPSDTRYSIHSHRGKIWLWSLTAAPSPTAMVWSSPARMQSGLVFDSTPDSWYDQFASNPMWTLLPKDLDDTTAYGATTDYRFLGFR